MFKQFHKIFFCAAFILFLLCTVTSSSAGENDGDVIILFDRSASMNEYEPELISKVWMLTSIKTFKKPYDVFLVGFDDRLHEYAKVTINNNNDIETLMDKFRNVETHGLTTDMEAPLRYLLKHDDIAFAVIISDGEPEIWDEKRWYLSKKIRTDVRYEELNKQYRSLNAQGVAKKDIYHRLKDIYYSRNLELINQSLAKLKERPGGKLAFLDISGDFKYFERWAKAANAQYILTDAPDDVETLQSTIIATQEKSSDILSEQLPVDHEEQTEPVTEPKVAEDSVSVAAPPQDLKPPAASTEVLPPDQKERVEPVLEPQVAEELMPVTVPAQAEGPVEPPAASTEEEQKELLVEPKTVEEPVPPPAASIKDLKTDVKETAGEEPSRGWLIILTVVIAVIFFTVLIQRRKKAAPAKEKLDMAKETISNNQTTEQVDARFKNLSLSSVKEANKFIDNEIQMTINDADKEQAKLLETEKDKFQFDKRSFLRIPLHPGAMTVHWINKNGERRHSNVINISMHGVMFEAADFDNDGKIDNIECPAMNIVFHVKQSRFIRNESGQVVAALDEFRDNIDDRIKWVEILTRVEGEQQ